MPRSLRTTLGAAVAALALAMSLASCTSRPTVVVSTATATPTATASETRPAESARAIDFKDPALVKSLIDHFKGGQVTPERITYTDVTGDRVEDAVVIVESGGTAGDLGAAVFSAVAGKPRLLGYIDQAGRIEVRLSGPVAGVIAVTQGVYAPADAQCCPSKLRELVFQWDGTRFKTVTDQVVDNPRR
ncbi:MAG: hypothetical protein AB7G21_08055 [Dehalococcoidia bacterium]